MTALLHQELSRVAAPTCEIRALRSVIDDLVEYQERGMDQLTPEQLVDVIGDARIPAECTLDQLPRFLLNLYAEARHRMTDAHYGHTNYGIRWELESLRRELRKNQVV